MTPEIKCTKVSCRDCGGAPRNHDIVREYEETWDDEVIQEHGQTTYQICRCRGCDAVRFRIESWSSMERNQSTGEYEVSVAVYPQVTKSDRMPFSTYELPDPVAAIYDETILAYNVGALTLAGGGLRAIVEAICLDQKVCGNNLAEKIDDLVSKDLLAKPQADLLHEERYIGNAALHEVVRPHRQDVDDGLAIVEGLINAIYILPSKAAKLKERREKKST